MHAIREMTASDYEPMIELWKKVEGLALSEADSRESIERYLARNQGFSFVCEQDGGIVGTVLCGHDGRRGYLYHLAVHPDYRQQKIGGCLVRASLDKLNAAGIDKCHIFVMEDNVGGNTFWALSGWEKRSGFFVYSRNL